jgi:hypothetical protein
MARRKRKKKKKTDKVGLGFPLVLGVGLLLAAVAYFLKDANGRPYHWLGSYLWLIAFVMTFIIELFYLTQFVLPLRWQESWFEGLRLAFNYNFPLIGKMFGVGSPVRKSVRPEDVPDGLTTGFVKHGAGLLDGYSCLALTRGSAFTRAAGPGYVSFNRGEMIDQVVDLRLHRRWLPVEARTRDGIPLDVTVTVIFQVKQEDEFPDSGRPYPYDPDAVFHVTYLGKFRTGQGALAWSDRIGRKAKDDLVDVLSRYTLDELFRTEQTITPPLEKITAELKRQLSESFHRYGITVFRVTIGEIHLPEAITEQRIENWQAGWQKKIQSEKVAGENEARRQITLAQARAQIEIVQRITESIEAMRMSGDVDLTDIINWRMLRAIEEAVADDTVQAFVPPRERATLQSAQALLQEWSRNK